MKLRDHLQKFSESQTSDQLALILREHGIKGFSLACRSARISRGAGKRMLGIYNDTGSIRQLTNQSCGYISSRSHWK